MLGQKNKTCSEFLPLPKECLTATDNFQELDAGCKGGMKGPLNVSHDDVTVQPKVTWHGQSHIHLIAS